MAITTWIGAAGAIRQRTTITIASAWGTGDTVTMVVGGSTLIVTAGGDVATVDIASILAVAINAETATAGLIGTESRNAGGMELAEFRELTADSSGSVVTIEGLSGVPFSIVVSQVTAGSGTATGATAQSATGPNHFDNPKNWLGGDLPVAGETVQFSRGSVDCLYGLDYMVTNTENVDWVFTTDYTGRVGLPEFREATNLGGGYTEYRTRFLALYDVLSAKTLLITAGTQGGLGGILQLNGVNFDCSEIVIDYPGTAKAEPSVRIYGGKSDEFYVGGGWVVLDPMDSPVVAGHELSSLIVGSGAESGIRFVVGPSVHFNTAIAGMFNSGSSEIQAALDQGGDEMAMTINGGMVESKRIQAHAGITIKDGGTYKWSGSGTASGSIAVQTGGTLDLRGSGEAQTYSGGITLFGGSTLHKGGHSVTPTFSGCDIGQCTITE